jgi:fluoride ion exporter CrcB/FEX
MNLGILNRICFGICVCTIVAGVVIGLLMIWTPGINETLWRLFATVGVVFLGAFATLSVSRTYGGSGGDVGEPGGGP